MKAHRSTILALTLTLALAGALAADGQLLDNLDGTVTDSRTGLVWVGNPDFVIDAGLADSLLMTKTRARELIAGMNSGALEGFGRAWRPPSSAELEHLLAAARPELLDALAAAAGGAAPLTIFWPVRAGSAPAGFEAVAVFATNSIYMKQGSDVLSGDVVANAPSPGPYLAGGEELTIGLSTTTPSGFAIKADSIKVKSSAAVACDDPEPDGICNNVFCNELDDNSGSVACTPLGTDPVFDFLPDFVAEPPRPGAADITVLIGESLSLDAGDYGDVTVKKNAALTFTGGVYNLRSLNGGTGSDFLFAAPSEVRIEGKFDTDNNSIIGPAAGSGISAADILFYVAGINGGNGNLGATPKAAQIGLANVANANFYVPNGTLYLRQNTAATGAFLGRDVIVGEGVQVSLDSAFANQPPTADPQEVSTSGAGAIVITLTGSDPEGDSLTFSIAGGPSQGSLSDLTPIVPDPVTDPETMETSQPPVVSATVTYTPNSGDDLEDSFVFQVADGNGGIGQATVTLNPPPEAPLEPPSVSGVVAVDRSAVTSKDVAVTLVLTADAPCDPTGAANPAEPCDGVGDDAPLTFALVGGPANGDLSALTQGSGVPQRTATVTYTPDPGFASPPDDSFTFEACGVVDGQSACDQGTVTLEVIDAQASAKSQKVTTPEDTPVTVTLEGSAGFPGSEKALAWRAAFASTTAVAGNVASTDGFVGDNHNDLPGPTPVLMAAAVDSSGGPGSNGTVRMHMEWDLGPIEPLAGEILSAEVVLTTEKGSVDSLDTSFFQGTFEQDGLLTDADYQIAVTAIPGVVMPVPSVPTGTQGTFTFDVTSLVQDALTLGVGTFTVQGRVNEALSGGGFQRGLQVHTSADSNIAAGKEPQLSITTSGAARPLTFSVVSLPASGSLSDPFGGAITGVPALLVTQRVIYTPGSEFTGTDAFSFQVDNGLTTATAVVTVIVGPGEVGDCGEDEEGCDDGRD